MLMKKTFYVALLIVGVCLLGLSVFLMFRPEIPKSVGGVCIGVGAGLFGIGLSNLIMRHWIEKQPDLMKENRIEFQDERNTMIRNRAKAVTCDIIQWFIIGIAFIAILIDAPLWVTLVVVGIFLLKNILELSLMSKYQKEM